MAAYALVVKDAMDRVVATSFLANEEIYIGRAMGCAVRLPGHEISRRHASLYLQKDGQVVIRDEGSANGVRVDGRRIAGPTIIDENSLVEIVHFSISLTKMVVEEKSDNLKSRQLPEISDEESSYHEATETKITALEPPTYISSGPRWILVGRETASGIKINLKQPVMTLGRSPENDFILDHPSISAKHAMLKLLPHGNGISLVDLNSSQGTFINGQKIKKEEDCTEGSLLTFGKMSFSLSLEHRRPTFYLPTIMARHWLLVVEALLVLVAIGLGFYLFFH